MIHLSFFFLPQLQKSAVILFPNPNRSPWPSSCQSNWIQSWRRGSHDGAHHGQFRCWASLPRSLASLSPWCTHVDLEQGRVLAGEAKGRKKGVDGDVVCECVGCGVGVKGHNAWKAEQIQGLIGSGNGRSVLLKGSLEPVQLLAFLVLLETWGNKKKHGNNEKDNSERQNTGCHGAFYGQTCWFRRVKRASVMIMMCCMFLYAGLHMEEG